MTEEAFFDTVVVIKDFLIDNREHEKYNTSNTDIIPKLSTQVKEEILHKMISGNLVSDYKNSFSGFSDAWEKFETYDSYYKKSSPKPQRVYRTFTDILNSMRNQYSDDFRSKYNKSIPGGKDYLHLAMAEADDCDSFITEDKDIKKLGQLNCFSNLERIVIINYQKESTKEIIHL